VYNEIRKRPAKQRGLISVSIIDSSEQQVMILNKKKEEILAHKEQIPDAPYHLFSINAMIRDAEMRYERLKGKYTSIKCSQCNQAVDDEMKSINLGRNIICERCIKTIGQVMNTTEFEDRHGLKTGTVKQDIHNTLHTLQGTGIIRKSGKCWLVHDVLAELYYDAGKNKARLEMSWVEEMERHLSSLQTQHKILNDIKGSLTGATLQLFSLDAQIKDYENRLRIVKGGTLPFRCSQCLGWIKEKGLPVLISHFTLCDNCKDTIQQVMTSSEAETKYNLLPGRIRKDIHKGNLEKYLENGLLRQSGGIWLFHETIIKHHYYPEIITPSNKPEIPSSLLARSAAVFQNSMEGR
jgi:hypothetical protein